MQTTGKDRDTKDQYYTRPDVAKTCVDLLTRYAHEGPWIEPSAGEGAFLRLVPGAVGYDIDPKSPGIHKQDFLDTVVPDGAIVFGNPPFGRQASLAKKFIRHAAHHARVIAFILPKSFTKPSMQTAFPLAFHLAQSAEVPADAFLVNGAPHSVPCVFQVWVRSSTDRAVVDAARPIGFRFTTRDACHVAFRRVGVNAGKCSLPDNQSTQSHYFLALDDVERAAHIIEESKKDWFVSNTTGPKSISKGEACAFLNGLLSPRAH